jgi:hypothetical protein
VKVTEKSPDPPPLGWYDPFHFPLMWDDEETGLPVDEEGEDGAGVVGMPPPGTTLLGGCDAVLEELEQAARSRPHAIAVPYIHAFAERFIPSSFRVVGSMLVRVPRSRNGLERSRSRTRGRLARWTP